MQKNQNLEESLLSTQFQDKQSQKELAQKEKVLSKNLVINGTSVFQKIFFTWVSPLLSFGSKYTMSLDMIPRLPKKYSTQSQFQKFTKIWKSIDKCEGQGWTLIKALIKMHLKEWIILMVVMIINVLFASAAPLLTALNIRYISNNRQNIWEGVGLFALTFFNLFYQRIAGSQIGYRFGLFGVRLSNVVTMLIYDKALKYSPVGDKTFSQAQIINYSQVDAEKLNGLSHQINSLFNAPLSLIIGMIIMYYFLGLTVFAAIAVLVVMMVTSYFVSKINKTLNEKSMKAKDKRMKATQEMLDIIRYIKIAAIEKFFFRKVDEKRQKEIKLQVRKSINIVLIICLYWLTNPILVTVSYVTFIYALGNQITSEVAFTTMAIVRMFQGPMFGLPNAINQLIQIFTSLKRIQKFLFAKEINNHHVQPLEEGSKNAIEISNGNFYWKREEEKDEDKEENEEEQQAKKEEEKEKRRKKSQDSSQQKLSSEDTIDDETSYQFHQKDDKGNPLYIHALKDINTEIRKGWFTMIVGDIGSGKSSFLLSIINQMLVGKDSTVRISGNIAYSPQKPWIMSKTLKENITFLAEQDQYRLNKVIHYACIEDDLAMLPKGIDTQIGQKGINISGGQKARVSLARSLYSGRDILLLDDVLSAVDVNVGQFLVKETIREFLKGKTVVMPTHAIKFASYADDIIVMKKGRIVRKGSYNQICHTSQFLEVSHKQSQHIEKEVIEQEQQVQEVIGNLKQKDKVLISDIKEEANVLQDDPNNEIIQQLMLPQDHQIGDIDPKVIWKFIKLNGGWKYLIAVMLAISGLTITDTSSDILIQYWCQNPEQSQSILYLFAGLKLGMIGFLFVASYVILISGLKKQSRIVHRQMIKRLLYASMGNFFNRIPTGRIINRLTKDLRELDQSIMHAMLWFLISAFQICGSLVICIYTTTPYIIIPIIVIGYAAHKVKAYYMKAQREVIRFEKSTNSPVVSGFLSTISGLATIRAYRKETQFTQNQYHCFDLNKKVRFTNSGMANWFSNSLATLSFAINMPCIAYSMFLSDASASTLGLLMNSALFLVYQLSGLIQCQAWFEKQLITMERLYKFMLIEPEKGYVEYCKNWTAIEELKIDIIQSGQLSFQDVKVRYRKDLPDVIKGIDCKIKAGEKIGIVGRTGAGKTTIINTLLGVTEISEGKILLDGTSIEEVSMKGLRQSVTMIDQDPTLIKSSFRENLDITHRYSDQELEDVLRECNLWEVIEEKGGIEAAVSNTSLSAGEKQLLCICRAFLKHSRVVLIDEATANIDVRNDSLIQKVISEKFKESTVLTIAHRLSTLRSSDKIMVMEQGRLVEFGSPNELENKQGGIYSEMMKKHQQEMLK